jgi:flagellar basal-body rod protein FlgB
MADCSPSQQENGRQLQGFRRQHAFAGWRQTFAAFPASAAPRDFPDGLWEHLARCLLRYLRECPQTVLRRETKGTQAMSDSLFGIHAAALELRSQRMGMIASNIANAATPGYKAKDIDFHAALAKSQADGGNTEAAAKGAVLYRTPVMPSLDGNTVEMQNEQVAFSENAVGYSATLEMIRSRVDTITRAMKGE